ncbi:MAG: MFS transporter [Bacteroidetes bacterium QS_9_68_14]|nr:MAG: MFS transporter [Bacteroidetes bacterium QS_9_68_14]
MSEGGDGSSRHDVAAPEERAGYLELMRGNTNFRRLWAGSVVSLLGDWFNTIALYVLVVDLTGSPLALGGVFVTKMIPWALVSPLAGALTDRYSRRRLMIGTDLARAAVVLGFLSIDAAAEVPWLYALIAAQVVLSAVFQPAKSAALPNITTPRELLTANALLSATWSTMLAVGAALGGLAAEALGLDAVFLIDSATYVVSAAFIWGTVIPQEKVEAQASSLVRSAMQEIVDGWWHLRAHPRIGRIAFAKATWAVAGGGLVYMVALLGDEVAPSAMAAGVGVLFMARGIGTGLGPIVARAAFTREEHWPAVLGGCIAVCGAGYVAASYAPWLQTTASVAVLCVLIMAAHAASGANWVLATVLLQKRTPDRFRGRVFGTEWTLVMATEALSILAASLLLEQGALGLRAALRLFGALQVGCGVLWGLLVVPRERRAVAAEE